jgi:GDPmannose 4,6-dehydratase
MRALITGVTGQGGSYLAEFLLDRGYEVYGLVRRRSLEKYDRIKPLLDRLKFIEGDLTDQSSLDSAIQSAQPDDVYNLAAQSFVAAS